MSASPKISKGRVIYYPGGGGGRNVFDFLAIYWGSGGGGVGKNNHLGRGSYIIYFLGIYVRSEFSFHKKKMSQLISKPHIVQIFSVYIFRHRTFLLSVS